MEVIFREITLVSMVLDSIPDQGSMVVAVLEGLIIEVMVVFLVLPTITKAIQTGIRRMGTMVKG